MSINAAMVQRHEVGAWLRLRPKNVALRGLLNNFTDVGRLSVLLHETASALQQLYRPRDFFYPVGSQFRRTDPPEIRERLFQPFYRVEGLSKSEGLGLGWSGSTAGAFRTTPSGAKCDPWQEQSQHCSVEFQATSHPECVHTAECKCSLPAVSRQAAILRSPSRKIAPWPGES